MNGGSQAALQNARAFIDLTPTRAAIRMQTMAARQRQEHLPLPGIGQTEAHLDRRVAGLDRLQALLEALPGLRGSITLACGGGAGKERLDPAELFDQLSFVHGPVSPAYALTRLPPVPTRPGRTWLSA